ncbi:hypothetical protein NKG94_02975 [Micromonospora sp. M12]
MSQYMLIMRGTDETNAAMMANVDELMAATRRFIEETAKAGVYVAAEGLDDPGQGAVVHFGEEAPVVTDGPYGETRELFGASSARRRLEAGGGRVGQCVPAVPGSKIEIRRVPGRTRSRRTAGVRQRRGFAREQRPELMGTADVEAVWRIESARSSPR